MWLYCVMIASKNPLAIICERKVSIGFADVEFNEEWIQ